MKRQLTISEDPIDEVRLLRERSITSEMGAVVNFVGVVRGTEGADPIAGLKYEAFQEMAAHQFNKIFDAVEKKWPVKSVRLIHRIGFVAQNEASLWLEVVAPHRAEAFEACQFIVEEMKRIVPIWKRKVTA